MDLNYALCCIVGLALLWAFNRTNLARICNSAGLYTRTTEGYRYTKFSDAQKYLETYSSSFFFFTPLTTRVARLVFWLLGFGGATILIDLIAIRVANDIFYRLAYGTALITTGMSTDMLWKLYIDNNTERLEALLAVSIPKPLQVYKGYYAKLVHGLFYWISFYSVGAWLVTCIHAVKPETTALLESIWTYAVEGWFLLFLGYVLWVENKHYSLGVLSGTETKN